MNPTGKVLVIGGGLAGLAAASALAARRCPVTVLEARNRLGGRASSFNDAASGQLVDNCQHVSMGCCTNLAHFFRTLGVAHLLEPQPCLYFMTPDGRVSTLRADPLPAPLHLARSFLSAHYLGLGDKLRIAWGLMCLKRVTVSPTRQRGMNETPSLARRANNQADDPPFIDWLRAHQQSEQAIARFWGLILTSALNETVERVGLRYARKVFVDAFMGHRRGFEVEVPAVPLGRLYGDELRGWFDTHGVELRFQQAVKRILVEGNAVTGIETRQGELLQADSYVAALPFDRLLDVLPESVVEAHACFANLRKLELSPIASVHLWYERAVLNLPHVVLLDGLGQWLFNRGVDEAGVQYLQVVISAARGLSNDELETRVIAELGKLLPDAARTRLLRSRVVTEHAATFSVLPGVDELRPGQETPLANLFLAGDWTATGWPATMEGAVRSGYLSAEAVLRRQGRAEQIVVANL